MLTENSKAIVRRLWEEVWNQNLLNVCDEIFDSVYAKHESERVPVVRTGFPDLQFSIEDMIAEGEKVVTRYVFTGTHDGVFMGIPATGTTISVKGIWIHRLEGDRIVEGREWGVWDVFGMMKQLGVV